MKRASLVLLLLLAACTTAPPAPPAEWFAPLPAEVKPYSWEITPDAAGRGEVILSKRTELGVFSNFAATPFVLDGRRYASVEGFWQAMYFPEGSDERAAVEQLSGFAAKNAGKNAKDHHSASYGGRRFDPQGSEEDRRFHLEIVERATRAKIDQNPAARELLRRTGDLVLRPDHHQAADATPAHHYFEILMRIRAELSR
jgi:predicted NAD-dependent protein-ADP-ribosyltransferase YbiA (DUF1768 family)